jgi:hypothetical protein
MRCTIDRPGAAALSLVLSGAPKSGRRSHIMASSKRLASMRAWTSVSAVAVRHGWANEPSDSTGEGISYTTSLTHHGHDEHDEEGVAHGEQRRGEGGEDLLGRLEPAEDAHDAEGAEHADGEVEGAEDDEGHEDDERVEEAPGVGDELAEALGGEVEEELGREEEGEARVEGVEEGLGVGRAAVGVEDRVRLQLRLGHRSKEVLRNVGGGVSESDGRRLV